jgi:hypothetical protein
MADLHPATNGSGNGSIINSNSAPSDLDPFNPKNLRVDVSFEGTVGVKNVLTVVPVRKPHKQEFVRIHPNPSFQLSPAALIQLQNERETYLVTPSMTPELVGQFTLNALYLGITRQKVLFIWPVRLPPEDGRVMDWHRSIAEAATLAVDKWVRVTPNMPKSAYDIDYAIGDLGEPEWPKDKTFPEILRIAFKDRLIDSPDHLVIKRLRGEI